jgi:hypothetical protein
MTLHAETPAVWLPVGESPPGTLTQSLMKSTIVSIDAATTDARHVPAEQVQNSAPRQKYVA